MLKQNTIDYLLSIFGGEILAFTFLWTQVMQNTVSVTMLILKTAILALVGGAFAVLGKLLGELIKEYIKKKFK